MEIPSTFHSHQIISNTIPQDIESSTMYVYIIIMYDNYITENVRNSCYVLCIFLLFQSQF